MTLAPAPYSAETNSRLSGPQTGVAIGDRIVGLEGHLPLQVAVVRVDREHRAVHQHHELFEPVDD